MAIPAPNLHERSALRKSLTSVPGDSEQDHEIVLTRRGVMHEELLLYSSFESSLPPSDAKVIRRARKLLMWVPFPPPLQVCVCLLVCGCTSACAYVMCVCVCQPLDVWFADDVLIIYCHCNILHSSLGSSVWLRKK